MIFRDVAWTGMKLPMIFQDVAWTGMKLLWQMVVPMLKSTSTNCDGSRLQKCHFFTGEGDDDTGNDRVLELGGKLNC
jgi:hypothetical protein